MHFPAPTSLRMMGRGPARLPPSPCQKVYTFFWDCDLDTQGLNSPALTPGPQTPFSKQRRLQLPWWNCQGPAVRVEWPGWDDETLEAACCVGWAWGKEGESGEEGEGLSHVLKIQCKTHEWSKLASDWPFYREGIVVGAVHFLCNVRVFSHCYVGLLYSPAPDLPSGKFLLELIGLGYGQPWCPQAEETFTAYIITVIIFTGYGWDP